MSVVVVHGTLVRYSGLLYGMECKTQERLTESVSFALLSAVSRLRLLATEPGGFSSFCTFHGVPETISVLLRRAAPACGQLAGRGYRRRERT